MQNILAYNYTTPNDTKIAFFVKNQSTMQFSEYWLYSKRWETLHHLPTHGANKKGHSAGRM